MVDPTDKDKQHIQGPKHDYRGISWKKLKKMKKKKAKQLDLGNEKVQHNSGSHENHDLLK